MVSNIWCPTLYTSVGTHCSNVDEYAVVLTS